jgi:hypothetical protein
MLIADATAELQNCKTAKLHNFIYISMLAHIFFSLFTFSFSLFIVHCSLFILPGP